MLRWADALPPLYQKNFKNKITANLIVNEKRNEFFHLIGFG